MRIKIKSRWPFIELRMVISPLSTQASRPSSASPSWSIFRDIHEMPLARWIALTVDGYEGAVVKSGNPPRHELLEAIHNLRTQYADAIGDGEYRLYCNLIKEITELELTLTQIDSLVGTLRNAYTPVLAGALNRLLRTSFTFDITRLEDYDRNLDRCLNRAKGYKISVDLKKASLAAIEKKHKNAGATPTREYYESVLITLEDEAKFPLDPESLTVWQYCERLRRYNKKSEQLKAQANGRRGN